MNSEDGNFKIRKATPEDSSHLLRLIEELAEFEKLNPPDEEARQRLTREIFSDKPILHALVAEVNGTIVGYALYLYSYSSFLARKTLYLEDIYISPASRGTGLGKKMMEYLIDVARREECGRMEWVVLDWNKQAIDFYDKLGAIELSDWKTYRLVLYDQNKS